jgi:hypothetical protein
VNKKNTGVQEFRSSGVQENPEQEDLSGDRSDLRVEKGLESPSHGHSELLNSSILNSFPIYRFW